MYLEKKCSKEKPSAQKNVNAMYIKAAPSYHSGQIFEFSVLNHSLFEKKNSFYTLTMPKAKKFATVILL